MPTLGADRTHGTARDRTATGEGLITGDDTGETPAATGGATAKATGVGGKPAASGGMDVGDTNGSGADTDGTGTGGTGTGGTNVPEPPQLENFSFFVTSFAAMQRLSKSPDGFGGDLRYGEADGLSGADKICTEIAETSMAGSGTKGWRAFLSVVQGPLGTPVHAIDRIGAGPWYDRLGRVVATNIAGLLTKRPSGGDPEIAIDLPNEDGVKNRAPDGTDVDNHDTLTGTDNTGKVFSTNKAFTCLDWTTAVGSAGRPRVGHSWSRYGAVTDPVDGTGGAPASEDYGGWKSALTEVGCAAGAHLVDDGMPNPLVPTVGSGGGYGGIFCFALKP